MYAVYCDENDGNGFQAWEYYRSEAEAVKEVLRLRDCLWLAYYTKGRP